MNKPVSTGETFFQNRLLLLKSLGYGLFSLSLLFRIRALALRYIEADELEHLRGAFCVFQGWLPYRDFFEHHTPLIYYLLAPLYRLGDYPAVIFASRGLMLLFCLLIFLLVFQLARKCFSPAAAWFSLIWLSYIFMFFEKSLEIRPDVPALAFFLLGLWMLADSTRNPTGCRSAGAGICLALAFLFTQKTVFPVFGVFLLLAIRALTGKRENGRRELNFNPLALTLIGFSVPLVLTLAFFYFQGGLSDFVYRNFTMNFLWKRRLPYTVFLNTLIYENPFFVFWAAGGIILTGFRLPRGGARTGQDLIWYPALLGLASLLLIPVVLPQTYALVIPLLVIPAGKALADFLDWIFQSKRTGRVVGSLILLISGPGLFWLVAGTGGYRPKLLWENPQILVPVYTFLGGAACLTAILATNRRRRTGFFCLFLLLLIGRPINFMINYDRLDNRGQLAEMEIIARETEIDDRVFDTWPIAGFFRLPAYYYHFLHQGVLMMLTPEEKGERLLSALQTRRPRLISRGINFNRLDPEILGYINTHYREHAENPNLLIRK